MFPPCSRNFDDVIATPILAHATQLATQHGDFLPQFARPVILRRRAHHPVMQQRRHALQLAMQLPDNVEDARLIINGYRAAIGPTQLDGAGVGYP